VGAVSVSFKDK